MTFHIVASKQAHPWLNYITAEFVRIQSANFAIQLVEETPEDTEAVIHYSQLPKGISIPDCSAQPLTGNTVAISDGFILEGTTKEGFSLPFDLLWNAFVFLSRKEEWDAEQAGATIASYALRHPRKDKTTFDKPIVNVLFAQLETFIAERFASLTFGAGNTPKVELSHDLDYIKKTIQLRMKQTAFNSFNTLKGIANGQFFKQAGKTFGFLFSNPSYWCFDFWDSLESRFETNSTFYIYTKEGGKNFKSWLIDPSYNIATNKALQEQLKKLHDAGHKIGLHGSFNSAVVPNQLAKEKAVLEKATGLKIVKTRQHWLNFKEDFTPFQHEQLFDFDSTIAWNDRMGFRSGCASIYRPYNHKAQKAFDFWEIPQVIMDSNLYDYAGAQSAQMISNAMLIIESLNTVKNAHISISWHPRTCSSDYNWHPAYEQLLEKSAVLGYL